MGIPGLMKLISDVAPEAVKENVMKNFFGRKVAIDASMCLYQFLIAVRTDPSNTFSLTNDVGETTSHLIGMFYRTIRMMENGIKPVYVFDGKPPVLKSGELAKRTKKKKEALEAVSDAKDSGDNEALAKANKRAVRVSPEHVEEAKKLLRLMGVPVVDAPCEADSQCVAFVKSGQCYGVATEDMDTLTLGVPLLIRYLTVSEARKKPVLEVSLNKVLEGLDLDMDQFIDLCILMGCDYSETIHGIGPKTAYKLIKKHKNIETILENLNTEKHKIPQGFMYKEAREMFKNPEITDCDQFDFQWPEPDAEGLIEFMVKEKGFALDRVERGIEKLRKVANTKVQERITSFFKIEPRSPPPQQNKKKNKKETTSTTPSKRRKVAA